MTLDDKLKPVLSNPIGTHRVINNHLNTISNGTHLINEPGSPLNFLLTSACVLGSSIVNSNLVHYRRMYPELAINKDDLLTHLSDKEQVGLYALPSEANFNIGFDVDELMNKMVDDPLTGIKKLVIPRHTYITVADTVFTLQYPVEIRLTQAGVWSVVYDTSVDSPLQPLDKNQLHWDFQTIATYDSQLLVIEVPLQQIEITSYQYDVSSSSGLAKQQTFTDRFCYARAWVSEGNVWRELNVLFQRNIHNTNQYTVVVKVGDGTVGVELPSVYLDNNILNRSIRIDVYTTKGYQDIKLNSYNNDQFSITWRDLDKKDLGQFSSPLSSLTRLLVNSLDTINGGRNELSFSELKQRVLTNSQGLPDIPITPHQITNMVKDRGYSLVSYLDNVTDRVYQVSRSLPVPEAGFVDTGAKCTVKTLKFNMDALKAHEYIFDNGTSITIPSKMVYEDTDELRPLGKNELEAIHSLEPEIKSNFINSNVYLYSPFYYVVDEVNGYEDTRPYHLDAPKVISQNFQEENESTQIQLSTHSYNLKKTETGYLLTVMTRTDEGAKLLNPNDITPQLSFIPKGETRRAYINGVYKQPYMGEWLYEFHIDTNLKIDRDHYIEFTNFLMFDNTQKDLLSELTQEMDICYYVKDLTAPGLTSSAIDSKRAGWLLDSSYVGISDERFKLRFGEHLGFLWSRLMVVPGPQEFERYLVDVYETYATDVYQTDVNGQKELVEDTDGKMQPVLLHSAGDPVLDVDNNPIVLHPAGTVKYVDGAPIIKEDRKKLYMTDLFLVEASVLFADDANVVAYKKSIPATVVNWLNDDLSDFDKRLLERTDIFYYPQNEIGFITAIVGENRRVRLRAEQTFTVTYYLTAAQSSDTDLKASLQKVAKESIRAELEKTQLSTANIISMIRDKVQETIVSVEMAGFANEYAAVTLVDSNDRLSIKKRLVAMPDNTVTLSDEVQVRFLRHTDV
jgi:hypothetical protein